MARRDIEPGRRRIVLSAVALGTATCAAVAAIVLVHEATRGRIAAHERARATAQLETLLAGVAHDNDVLGDVTYVRDPDLLGTRAAVPAYRVRLGGRPVAVVLSPVAPDGYIGSIELRVAIRADGRILAVRAVRHHDARVTEFDTSCFSGEYVTGDITPEYLARLQSERSDQAKAERSASGAGRGSLKVVGGP